MPEKQVSFEVCPKPRMFWIWCFSLSFPTNSSATMVPCLSFFSFLVAKNVRQTCFSSPLGVFFPRKTHGMQPWPSPGPAPPTGSHPKIYIQPPEQPLKAAVVARVGGSKNLWVARGFDGVPSGYGTGCYGSHGLLIDDLLVKHCDYP